MFVTPSTYEVLELASNMPKITSSCVMEAPRLNTQLAMIIGKLGGLKSKWKEKGRCVKTKHVKDGNATK
jgi:hypothetical protein